MHVERELQRLALATLKSYKQQSQMGPKNASILCKRGLKGALKNCMVQGLAPTLYDLGEEAPYRVDCLSSFEVCPYHAL